MTLAATSDEISSARVLINSHCACSAALISLLGRPCCWKSSALEGGDVALAPIPELPIAASDASESPVGRLAAPFWQLVHNVELRFAQLLFGHDAPPDPTHRRGFRFAPAAGISGGLTGEAEAEVKAAVLVAAGGDDAAAVATVADPSVRAT